MTCPVRFLYPGKVQKGNCHSVGSTRGFDDLGLLQIRIPAQGTEKFWRLWDVGQAGTCLQELIGQLKCQPEENPQQVWPIHFAAEQACLRLKKILLRQTAGGAKITTAWEPQCLLVHKAMKGCSHTQLPEGKNSYMQMEGKNFRQALREWKAKTGPGEAFTPLLGLQSRILCCQFLGSLKEQFRHHQGCSPDKGYANSYHGCRGTHRCLQ